MQGQIIDGVHKFLGIPYAEPPFGTLRWLTPVRRKPWSGVLQATQYGQICPQTGGMARDALVPRAAHRTVVAGCALRPARTCARAQTA